VTQHPLEHDTATERETGILGGYAGFYDEYATVPFPGDAKKALLSALPAGALAGLAMLATLGAAFALAGRGFWSPLKLTAVPIFGPSALLNGLRAVIAGLALHMAISLAMAAIFAVGSVWLIGRVRPLAGAFVGVLYGLIVWFVAQHVILPATYPLVAEGFSGWAFAASHLIYGLVVGVFPSAYRLSHEEYEALRVGHYAPPTG